MSRPGGPLAALPLHFVWIADCSGSMASQGKMASLNHAAQECLPHMRRIAGDNPHAEVLVRVLKFSTGASWAIERPTPLQFFQWPELKATVGGLTDLGAALTLLAKELQPGVMPARALPPVLVLCTDGLPTDSYREGLELLLGQPWGAKAIKLAIAIGREADLDTLRRFIDSPVIRPLRAQNADDLVRHLRWASTSVLEAASSPYVGAGSDPGLRPTPDPTVIHDHVTW
jgi:uncharacterized protein YegL